MRRQQLKTYLLRIPVFYALLDENITEMKRIGSIFGSDNFSLEWRIPIAQINEESHTYKTQGQWINKKLQLIDQSPYQNDTQKKEFAEKALNEYKTLLSDEKEFHQAFPTFKESGFSTTPYLYCALNKYQPNTQIQFDTIDEKEQIKKGSYTLTCHLDAILPHLPFAQNLIHFNQAQTNNIPRVSNDPYSETLCITLPLEYEEGLEKVYAYLKNLDPTQLRTTQQTETIALFQLCQYWGIKEHDSVIFHNYSEKELTDKELFSLACDTNSQYLLQKSIRALLQQGGQSEDQYDNALELFIKCNPPIEKLDLTGLNLTDPLIKLLKYSKENLKELNLTGNNQLTDTSLIYLSVLGNLTILNLRNCKKITDKAINTLSEKLKLNTLVPPETEEEKRCNKSTFENGNSFDISSSFGSKKSFRTVKFI
jgi:hypothetical protein